MKTRLSIAVLLCLISVCACFADSSEPTARFDVFTQGIEEVLELVDRALYLAAAGISSYEPADQRLYAQGLINLLEGSSSPDFDARNEFAGSVPTGIRELFLEVALPDDSEDWDFIAPMSATRDSEVYQSISSIDHFFRLANTSAHDAFQSVYSLYGAWDAFRACYAYLVAARGDVEPVLIGGLTFLLGMFPLQEIWVSEGDALQTAIDAISDGGIIYLDAGTHIASTTIDKSVTLIGSDGAVLMSDPESGFAISVSAQAPITVTIRNVEFSTADVGAGIDIGENATVELNDVFAHGLGTVIRVHDGGTAIATDCGFSDNGSTMSAINGGTIVATRCTFTDNRYAVHGALGSTCTLTDCIITGCTGDYGAVATWCTDLTLDNCRIRDCEGSAIDVGGGEASRLHIVNCQLTRNAYGIDLTYGSCNPGGDPDWEAPTQRSYGTLTGWGNVIPGPQEMEGNREGAFYYCFQDYLEDPAFLLEPKPEDE